MDTGLINERAPFTKEAQGRVWGSLPPLLRSQHELSRPMEKRPAYGRNSGIPAGSPPPTLLPAGIPGLFPRGLRRRARVTRTRSESAGACWVAKGRGDPTPPFCIRACSPRPRSRTHGSALPEGALSGPHAERSSRSLCAGARTRPPISVQQCAPPPPNSAHSVTRPAGRAAPPRARVEPRVLPGSNLSGGERGGASRVHEAGKPAPAAALPTPPRRQQQVRVHHCQARAQPPRRFPAPRDYRSCRGSVAGSGRRSRPEGGAGSGTGRAGSLPRPQRPLAARAGAGGGRRRPDSVALATTARIFRDGPGSSFPTLCPYGGRTSLGDRVVSLRSLG